MMDSLLERSLADDEEIKKKTCDKIRERVENCKTFLKRIKEEFRKKSENKDDIQSMLSDFNSELEDFKKMIQFQGNFLFVPREIINIIDDFKEPQEFLVQEKTKLMQIYDDYQKKRNNFGIFAEELKKGINS